MSDPITITIFTVGIGLSVPILLAALGELVAEQAGVINVGIEGVMLIGAIAAAIMFHFNDSFLLATLVGVGTGLLCGAVLGWMYVFRGMNQIVTGFVFNIFALGLTTSLFASEEYLAGDLNDTLPDISVPVLESIPWLGEVLFQQDAMVYAAIVATVAIWLLMSRTWFGVYVRAAGERPSAVLATGRDVQWVRFNAMLIACGFAGISWLAPHLLAPLNRAWFGLSLLLSKVMNPIVMGLLYAVAIIPFGLVMQLLRDPLVRKRRPEATTYWVDRTAADEPTNSMKNQF